MLMDALPLLPPLPVGGGWGLGVMDHGNGDDAGAGAEG